MNCPNCHYAQENCKCTPSKATIIVDRFCKYCYNQWSEIADRDRLKAIIKNSSLDCPKCKQKENKI